MTKKYDATKLPKVDTIFQHAEDNLIYLYKGFAKPLNGYMFITYDLDKGSKSYLFACHSEFLEKFVKIGHL